jgi:hypothetical protein
MRAGRRRRRRGLREYERWKGERGRCVWWYGGIEVLQKIFKRGAGGQGRRGNCRDIWMHIHRNKTKECIRYGFLELRNQVHGTKHFHPSPQMSEEMKTVIPSYPKVSIEPSCHERHPNNPPLPGSLSLVPRRLEIRPRPSPLPENPRLGHRIIANGNHRPAYLPTAIFNAHRSRSTVCVDSASRIDALSGRMAVAGAGGVRVAEAVACAAVVVAAADGGVGAGAGNGGAGSGLAGGAGCALRRC